MRRVAGVDTKLKVDWTTTERNIKLLATTIEADILDYVRAIVVECTEALSQYTPIDTGLARSNWRVSILSASSDIVRPHSPYPSRWPRPGYDLGGKPGGDYDETANVTPSRRHAEDVMKAYRGEHRIVIRNSVEYIKRLDEGHSPQTRAFIGASVVFGLQNAKEKYRFRRMEKLGRGKR